MLLAIALGACTSGFDDSASSAAPGGPSNNGTGAGPGGTTSQGGSSSGGTAATVPPEQEESQSFRAPVVSGRWVWTANPDTDKVAIVDAKSFSVRLAEAGHGPTYLTALPADPNTSKALVINVGSKDASLLSANDAGAVSVSAPIPLQADANAWAVSKTGKFAIAWTDTSGFTPDPAQFYQDISVLDLSGAKPVATRLVVGPLPSRVFITDDETTAFIVASSGISVIDLAGAGGPTVSTEEAVSDDVKEDASARDVSVLPDGSYALVRHEGSAVVTVVRLSDGKREQVALPGPITDLDLVPDAKSALAVVRGDGSAPAANDDLGNAGAAGALAEGGASGDGAGGDASEGGASGGPEALPSTLAILPLPGIFAAPTSFTTFSVDDVFGLVNIAPKGTLALLYTNAVASTHLTVLQTAPGDAFGSHREVDVHGIVHDVFPSPDGAYAIASLTPKIATDKPGFAVVPVAGTLPTHTQTTEAPVFAVAQSASPAARAIVTVSDGSANFAAYIVRMPELVVDRVKLPSKPLAGATGLVPEAGVAYIAESHPDGRITFIDLQTGVPRTITGFEISSKVVDGN